MILKGGLAERDMDAPGTLTILLTVAVLVGSAATLWLLLRALSGGDRNRPGHMRKLAEQLGMRYYGSAGSAALEHLPRCALFERDGESQVKNLIGAADAPPRRLLFDWEFRSPRARPETGLGPALYLVAMARLGARELPAFRVYWRNWLGGPVGVEGLRPVRFEEDAEFGHRLLIATEQWPQTREVLRPPVREALLGWTGAAPRPVVEVARGWVVAHVESEPGDARVQQTGSALLQYAAAIGQALTSP